MKIKKRIYDFIKSNNGNISVNDLSDEINDSDYSNFNIRQHLDKLVDENKLILDDSEVIHRWYPYLDIGDTLKLVDKNFYINSNHFDRNKNYYLSNILFDLTVFFKKHNIEPNKIQKDVLGSTNKGIFPECNTLLDLQKFVNAINKQISTNYSIKKINLNSKYGALGKILIYMPHTIADTITTIGHNNLQLLEKMKYKYLPTEFKIRPKVFIRPNIKNILVKPIKLSYTEI